MGMQPARIYKKPPKHPYTRTSRTKKHKEYIKGVPGSKINIFKAGNPNGDFDHELHLTIEKDACLRSNALEAMRIAANNYIKKHIELSYYYLYVPVYPHHVIRYHPQAGVAQADRFYQGMRKPFGRPIGRAAIVDKGQTVLFIRVNDENVDVAREALRRASNKLGTGSRVHVKEAPTPEVVKETISEAELESQLAEQEAAAAETEAPEPEVEEEEEGAEVEGEVPEEGAEEAAADAEEPVEE